ncbi:helix-turn-helix domain-containing protein [Streptomyces noursei]|uniref:helix-turn-helix domain-containing protein n=1 Tax=Streptomyces noursei TaxID=1971 RepID=UPI003F55EF34
MTEEQQAPEEWPRPTKRRKEAGLEERYAIGVRLRALYDGGMSIREIAAETHYSYGYVNTCLKLAGATMRPRGFNRHVGKVLSA